MNSQDVRRRFLNFFEKRGHATLPSASLVPENDPSALFTTAGVQPIIPYILQGEHPKGKRLASVQKCVRTTDIDDVGDNTHATFFEMMGNWSIGDYFKSDAIKWSWELLTSKDEGFGLDPARLFVTVFEGDENAPRDEESYNIWTEFFASAGFNPEKKVFWMSAKTNWWPQPKPGDTASGPCGPDTEMFYDVTPEGLGGELTKEEYIVADDAQKVVEIWNDVFMEFRKENGVVVGKLDKQNVDTGSGFERTLMVLQGVDNIYETDVLAPFFAEAENISDVKTSQRIIADHVRTAIFMITDGVSPANTDRGYVLRRLLRRAIFHTRDKKISTETASAFVGRAIAIYGETYGDIAEKKEMIVSEIVKESEKFEKTIRDGIRHFEKLGNIISGKDAFILFSTYGFPFEMSLELAKEKGITVDEEDFKSELASHQELSRTSSAGKFKGGLAGYGEMETKYHTATHLLNAALRKVLGEHVGQKGSNINVERLRFDFSHPEKMTDEQKKQVEDIVNEAIQAQYPVSFKEMLLDEAQTLGAIGVFGEKYPDTVKVYTVGDDTSPFSREICGGPHVENTGTLGVFKIKKEEAVSAGVRRIKAILE